MYLSCIAQAEHGATESSSLEQCAINILKDAFMLLIEGILQYVIQRMKKQQNSCIVQYINAYTNVSCIYHALLKRSTAQPFASPKVGDLTTYCRFGAAELEEKNSQSFFSSSDIMNRIREHENKYQVLITPHHRFDAGIELMMGNWMDENFSGYKILTFDNLRDAMREARKYPDINWDQMVLWNKDNFNKLYGIIRYEIGGFGVKIIPVLRDSKQTKELMFNGVTMLGDNFRLLYNMNIISFYIIVPNQANIHQVVTLLSDIESLRIQYKTNNDKGVNLVGQTDLGTTYEIQIRDA
jgi:hypothetical protein